MENGLSDSKTEVLNELRDEAKSLIAFGDVLDNKLSQLLANGGLILGLFSLAGAVKATNPTYWIILTLSIIIYLIGLVLVSNALSPMPYIFPVFPDWDYLAEHYFPLTGEALQDLLISQTLVALSGNKEILAKKSNAVRWGLRIFALCLIALAGGLIHIGGFLNVP